MYISKTSGNKNIKVSSYSSKSKKYRNDITNISIKTEQKTVETVHTIVGIKKEPEIVKKEHDIQKEHFTIETNIKETVSTTNTEIVIKKCENDIYKQILKNINNKSQVKGGTSDIYIDKDNQIVVKKVKRFKDYDVFLREIYWLKYLNEKQYSWCPKLLFYDNESQIIILNYIGPSINKKNKPADWREQLKLILNDLVKENICHNDINKNNVLIKDNKLFLIDYGWASKINDWSCNGVFDKRKKPSHVYFDKNAIKTIEMTLK